MENVIYLKSVLDVNIKILKIGWLFICQKHKDLKDRFDLLQSCLENADEIWLSRQDPQVYLYYKNINKKHICAVCKHYNSQGFLITAYFTYKLQGKKKLWPK